MRIFEKNSQKNQGFQRGETPFGHSFEKGDSLRENLYNFSQGWLKKAWMGFQKKSQKNQGFQRGETPFGRSFGESESLREYLYNFSQGWLKKA